MTLHFTSISHSFHIVLIFVAHGARDPDPCPQGHVIMYHSVRSDDISRNPYHYQQSHDIVKNHMRSYNVTSNSQFVIVRIEPLTKHCSHPPQCWTHICPPTKVTVTSAWKDSLCENMARWLWTLALSYVFSGSSSHGCATSFQSWRAPSARSG